MEHKNVAGSVRMPRTIHINRGGLVYVKEHSGGYDGRTYYCWHWDDPHQGPIADGYDRRGSVQASRILREGDFVVVENQAYYEYVGKGYGDRGFKLITVDNMPEKYDYETFRSEGRLVHSREVKSKMAGYYYIKSSGGLHTYRVYLDTGTKDGGRGSALTVAAKNVKDAIDKVEKALKAKTIYWETPDDGCGNKKKLDKPDPQITKVEELGHLEVI